MIAYLEGKLHQSDHDHLVLLVNGVGYLVHVSKYTLQKLPPLGEPLRLHIHTVVREDSLSLYGFQSSDERELFLKLIGVNGIGPKMALTILSKLSPADFAKAVCNEDLVQITAIPGVGKKTAERLIMELKEKILAFFPHSSSSEEPLRKGKLEAALSALTNLGYTRQEAQQAVQEIPNAHELPLEVLIREGLKALSG